MSQRVEPELINKIVLLRKRGYSIPEISQEVSISKSTVLRYVKDVLILPEFMQEWNAKRGGSKKRMLLKEKKSYEEAKALLSELSFKERLLFISALYWAEGNKKDMILINSDPNLIKVYINGLRDLFKISNDRISINIRIHSNLDKTLCLNFWSGITGIPVNNFRKTEIIEGKKTGKLQYGMCRIRLLKGSDLLKKMMSINKVVYEVLSTDMSM